MNHKTMLVCVFLAGSMQSAWGMCPRGAGNYPGYHPSRANPRIPAAIYNDAYYAVPKQEVSEIARLTAALEALNVNVQNMSKQMINANDQNNQANEKIQKLEKTVEELTAKIAVLEKSQDKQGQEISRRTSGQIPVVHHWMMTN